VEIGVQGAKMRKMLLQHTTSREVYARFVLCIMLPKQSRVDIASHAWAVMIDSYRGGSRY
jgi:hypothetical protein